MKICNEIVPNWPIGIARTVEHLGYTDSREETLYSVDWIIYKLSKEELETVDE